MGLEMRKIVKYLCLIGFVVGILHASPYETTSWLVNQNKSYAIKGFAVDYYNTRTENYERESSFLASGTMELMFVAGERDSIKITTRYTTRDQDYSSNYDLVVTEKRDTVNYNDERITVYYGYSGVWPAKFIMGNDYAYYYLEHHWKILFDFEGNYIPSLGNTGFGSGFAINERTMVTNQHVVDGADSIFATNDYQDDSSNITLSVIYEDLELDIAVLKSDKKLTSCAIDRKIYDIGEDVTVYGYPQILKQGFSLKATKGIISSRKGYQDDVKTYQIDAAVQPGNSGGPLVRKDKIIGIVVSRLEGKSQNVNYAIKSNFLGSVLDVLKINNTGKAKPKDCTYTIMKADAEWLKSVGNK